jgi:hypothetical protein
LLLHPGPAPVMATGSTPVVRGCLAYLVPASQTIDASQDCTHAGTDSREKSKYAAHSCIGLGG